MTSPSRGHLTGAEPLSPLSGVPALLVLSVLVAKNSVYGPYVIPLADSQENGTGFQNTSM